MAKGLENYALYNFYNLQEYCNMLGINYDATYFKWLKDIINTKVSMFKYKNLPGSLTNQIMETSLLFRNYLCFYYDKRLQEVVLCCYRFGGDYDLYYKPVTVDLLTISGRPLAVNVPYENIVPVRDNDMDIIPFLTLNAWIGKVIDAEKTLDILVRLVRFPTVISGSKEQATMLKKLLEKNLNYEGFVIGDKTLGDVLQQNDIKLPTTLEEMYSIMEKYRNMALASMGIYDVDNKRERLITNEVQSNNDYVDFVYQGMLNQRQEFVKLANEKWGLNIELVESYDLNKTAEMQLEAEGQGMIAKEEAKYDEKGGKDNEQLETR